MGISGNLQTMDLAELLQWLSQGQKTGTLVIHSGTVEKRVFFRDGRIVSSASSDPKEHLGHFLVSYGYIDEDTLAQAVSLQESKRSMLGRVLVTLGKITEPDLHRMLRLKAEESIYDIFTWNEGEFRFLDGNLPSHDMVPLSLDVTGIVLEGGQRLDEGRRIRTLIPHSQVIPVAVGTLEADEEEDPGATHILELVDDDRTLEEIAIQAHASEFRVAKVLYEQARRKRLKIVKPRAPTAAASSNEHVAVTPEALVAAGERHLAEGDPEKALRHLRAARSLEPDDRAIEASFKRAEAAVQAKIAASAIQPTSIPYLNLSLESLTKHKFSPQEGFLLSRINGTYDVQSILKISPIPPVEAQLALMKLVEGGYVKLRTR